MDVAGFDVEEVPILVDEDSDEDVEVEQYYAAVMACQYLKPSASAATPIPTEKTYVKRQYEDRLLWPPGVLEYQVLTCMSNNMRDPVDELGSLGGASVVSPASTISERVLVVEPTVSREDS
ncbi:MAG: hypothetical protein ACKPKO_26820, partial [Candidatus Fonsibacter sp.]